MQHHRASPSLSPSDRLRSSALRMPLLEPDDERALLERAQKGDKRALARLCESHLRLVFHVAQRYERASIQLDELVNEGVLGLIEAVHKFDVSHSTRLSSYATWWIRARVREYAYRSRNLIAMPSTRACRIARGRIAQVEEALSIALQRSPTRAELAEALGIDVTDVECVTAALSGWEVSLNAEPYNSALEPRDDERSPEDALALSELRQQLDQKVDAILPLLCERDRKIVREHFREGTATTTRLGDELGISRQRVAQIVNRVASKLKQELSHLAER